MGRTLCFSAIKMETIRESFTCELRVESTFLFGWAWHLEHLATYSLLLSEIKFYKNSIDTVIGPLINSVPDLGGQALERVES